MPETGADDPDVLTYRYVFTRAGGGRKEFVVRLDRRTLALIPPPRDAHPAWTALSFHRCRNCPLDEAAHPRCPPAANLVDLIAFVGDIKSYEQVDVSVESRQRTYQKRTTMQVAASALIGLLMASSGCPVLDRLRPLVETHTPFSSPEETVYRMLTMYLAGQYFRHRQGKPADWDLQGLVRFLDEVQAVNSDFIARLRAAVTADAGLNAVDTLNTLGVLAGMSITEDHLNRLAKIFEAHVG